MGNEKVLIQGMFGTKSEIQPPLSEFSSKDGVSCSHMDCDSPKLALTVADVCCNDENDNSSCSSRSSGGIIA
jgi:hypothetical protein